MCHESASSAYSRAVAGAADDSGGGSAAPSADGRTARRDRNREAVLDAVLELFGEDAVQPTPDQVAERSGVSLRSVYRYFEDMDALVRAAMTRHMNRAAPLFALAEATEGTTDERVARLVAQRLALHAEVAPVARAATLRAGANALIARRLAEQKATLRRQVDDVFDAELAGTGAAGRERAAAIDVLIGFESLDHLRRERGLAVPAVERVLIRAVTAILR